MTNNLFGKDTNRELELEKEFQDRVASLARIHKWKCYSVPDSRRATLSGFPDLTLFRNGRLIFAELKREKGRVSPAQKDIMDELAKIPCASVYLWRPSNWDEIIKILK
jgi:hypothetical protein